MSDGSKPNFDANSFRRTLGQFPTGVTVITVQSPQGKHIGVTASSFNSVSVDPPLVLWSVDKRAYSAEIFKNCEHFAVNVLADHQVDISNLFASQGADKFGAIEFSESPGGAALFNDYAAQFECKLWNAVEGGDHIIIIGEVLDFRSQVATQPLVFSRGSYAVASPHPTSISTTPIVPADGIVGDFTLYMLREIYTRYTTQLYPRFFDQFGISAEEWRVMAFLVDHDSATLESIVPVVLQPYGKLRELLEWLQEKGNIRFIDEQTVELTESGHQVAQGLWEIAKQHEAQVLASLPSDEATQFKDMLKTIMLDI